MTFEPHVVSIYTEK